MMHPALKFNFDSFKLRSHSLFRSGPPYGEGCCLVALPKVVGEAQEREGLRFSLASLSPVASGEPPELDQPCLVRFQAELCQPFLKLSKEAFSICPVLKTQRKIVGVANDDDIALRHFPAPDISPQIEEVMQVHVCDQW